MTKVKYEPRYKAGDWIVISNGIMFDGSPRTAVIRATASNHNYIRHATEEDLTAKKARMEADNQRRAEFEALRNSQPYQDAGSILCLDAETLISKLGPEMLREIAERLR